MKTIKVSKEFLDEIIVEELKQDFIDAMNTISQCSKRSKENPLDVSNLNEYKRSVRLASSIYILLEYYMIYNELIEWQESVNEVWGDLSKEVFQDDEYTL